MVFQLPHIIRESKWTDMDGDFSHLSSKNLLKWDKLLGGAYYCLPAIREA